MNRKTFFKTLGGAIAAAVIGPRVLAEETPEGNNYANNIANNTKFESEEEKCEFISVTTQTVGT